MRPGNVHSADGWGKRAQAGRGPLQRTGSHAGIYFRGDAGFAMPDLYDFLEAEHQVRDPPDRRTAVLQKRSAICFARPRGRPSHRCAALPRELHLSGRVMEKKRRVVAKVEWYPGELFPRVGFIVTNMTRPPSTSSPSTTSAARASNDQGGQGRDQMDAAVMPFVRRQRRSSSTSCARLQPGNFLRTLATPEPIKDWSLTTLQREADQDWREGRRPRPLRRVPDGRGRHSAKPVRRHPADDRGLRPPPASTA